jgi:hypothetical protein
MLTSRSVLELIEVCVWRNVKVGEVGDDVGVIFAGALVWGDVDPHGCCLCACESDCSARKSPLILPDVVMTAGRKKKLCSS